MTLPNISQIRIAMMAQAKLMLRLEVREHGGQNRGEVVGMIIRRQGGTPGPAGPWCAAFWATMYELACGVTGVKPAFDPGMSTSANVRRAKEVGKLTDKPMPGDAACFKGSSYGTGYEHTGMVWSKPANNGDYMTIEGNVGNRVQLCYRNTSRNPATFITCE